MNRYRTNYGSVRDVRRILESIRPSLHETLRLSEDDELGVEYDIDADDTVSRRHAQAPLSQSLSVKDKIVEMRKIAISVIAELADDPTSVGYGFMKKVLDMSDKTIEALNNGQTNYGE